MNCGDQDQDTSERNSTRPDLWYFGKECSCFFLFPSGKKNFWKLSRRIWDYYHCQRKSQDNLVLAMSLVISYRSYAYL